MATIFLTEKTNIKTKDSYLEVKALLAIGTKFIEVTQIINKPNIITQDTERKITLSTKHIIGVKP
jgi:hypothetical protein